MPSPILLAQAQKILTSQGCSISAEHEDFSDGGVDTVTCTGRKAWRVAVKSSMAGYGIFIDSWFFALGDYIALVQLYEHSRGGHTDPTLTLFDYEGALRGTVHRYAGEFGLAAFSDTKVWLLHNDARQHRAAGLANFTGSCLMQIDLPTGQLESETPIQVPEKFFASQHLAHGWLTTIGLSALRVRFAESAAGVVLETSVVNYQRDAKRDYERLQIPLADFLRTST